MRCRLPRFSAEARASGERGIKSCLVVVSVGKQWEGSGGHSSVWPTVHNAKFANNSTFITLMEPWQFMPEERLLPWNKLTSQPEEILPGLRTRRWIEWGGAGWTQSILVLPQPQVEKNVLSIGCFSVTSLCFALIIFSWWPHQLLPGFTSLAETKVALFYLRKAASCYQTDPSSALGAMGFHLKEMGLCFFSFCLSTLAPLLLLFARQDFRCSTITQQFTTLVVTVFA